MNIKPINQKKYTVWGHQLEEIGYVIDALATVSRIGEVDYPEAAVFSIVNIAYEHLNALMDRIEYEQEISS